MRLIFEGPDNAGKTSLALRLREYAGANGLTVEYFHPGGPPKDFAAEVDCMVQQRNLLGSSTYRNLIMDRITAISQQVYNPNPDLDPTRGIYLKNVLDVQPILIYCRPSTDRLLRTQDLTWRDGETEEHKQKIIEGQHTFVQRYDELMQRTPHIVYNFEDSLAESLERELKKALHNEVSHGWLQQIMHCKRTF